MVIKAAAGSPDPVFFSSSVSTSADLELINTTTDYGFISSQLGSMINRPACAAFTENTTYEKQLKIIVVWIILCLQQLVVTSLHKGTWSESTRNAFN